MRTIKKGAASQSIYFDVLDSTSTTGGRKTGLAFNTSSLVAYYVRSQGTATAITLATLAAANTAWSSGGFKEVDATNMPGIYRLDVPDAAFAAGAGDSVAIVIKGAAGMVQASCDVQLVAYDPQDAVRAGLTALPNAAAEAAGGLYTRGTGAGQINQDGNGRVDTNVVNWKGSAAAAMTGDAYARLGAPAGASVSADVAAVKVDTAAIKVQTDKVTFTVANQVDVNVLDWKGSTAPAMTGDAYARIGAAGAGLTALGDTRIAHLDADISSRMATFSYTAPLDAAGTRTAIGLASANLDTQIGTLATGTEITSLQSHGDGAWATATGFSTLDATAVENAVWDATAASHVTSGSFGAAVDTLLSEVGTIEGRIGTPAFGDLAGDIAHAQGVIDGINGVTSTLVLTAGKLWVLDENGNPLPHTSDISTIESAIGALPAASDNAAAVLAATYEGAETVQDHFRLARAALYGKANGLAGTTVHYRDAADAKNRLTAIVDADGNRTSITADAT